MLKLLLFLLSFEIVVSCKKSTGNSAKTLTLEELAIGQRNLNKQCKASGNVSLQEQPLFKAAAICIDVECKQTATQLDNDTLNQIAAIPPDMQEFYLQHNGKIVLASAPEILVSSGQCLKDDTCLDAHVDHTQNGNSYVRIYMPKNNGQLLYTFAMLFNDVLPSRSGEGYFDKQRIPALWAKDLAEVEVRYLFDLLKLQHLFGLGPLQKAYGSDVSALQKAFNDARDNFATFSANLSKLRLDPNKLAERKDLQLRVMNEAFESYYCGGGRDDATAEKELSQLSKENLAKVLLPGDPNLRISSRLVMEKLFPNSYAYYSENIKLAIDDLISNKTKVTAEDAATLAKPIDVDAKQKSTFNLGWFRRRGYAYYPSYYNNQGWGQSSQPVVQYVYSNGAYYPYTYGGQQVSNQQQPTYNSYVPYYYYYRGQNGQLYYAPANQQTAYQPFGQYQQPTTQYYQPQPTTQYYQPQPTTQSYQPQATYTRPQPIAQQQTQYVMPGGGGSANASCSVVRGS